MIDQAKSFALTVEVLQTHGVELVSASCWNCNYIWKAPIMMLPGPTTLAKIGEVMFCHECGGRNIHVEPVWPTGGGRKQ